MTHQKNKLQESLTGIIQKKTFDIHHFYNQAYLCPNVRMPILDKIAGHFGDISGLPSEELIYRIRNYVYVARDSDEKVWNTANSLTEPKQIANILQAIWRYHEGKSKTGVDMSCQASMLAMGIILQSFGIPSRETSLLSIADDPVNQKITSHAVLEVWNKDKNRWELHDPIGDIVYAVKEKSLIRPVSASEFFFFNKEKLTFMSENRAFAWPASKQSDWSYDKIREHTEYYINRFSDIVVSRYLSYGPVGMINLDNVDMTKRFRGAHNQNIVEFLNHAYSRGGSPPVLQGWYTEAQRKKALTLPPLKEGFEISEFYPWLYKK